MDDNNLTKLIVDEYSAYKFKSKEDEFLALALRTGATVRAVESWYKGEHKPMKPYRLMLERILEQRKRAAEKKLEVNHE